MVLFFGTLLLLWCGKIHLYSTIGGLLPYDDASGYYIDARRALSGARFSAFAARRPLAPGLLATILAITGGNLKLTVAIMAALDALCCFAFVRETGRWIGGVAALVAAGLLFAFQFRYVGTTVTEHVGFSLGALGFALLFQSARHRDREDAVIAIFAITVGLNARAGAFFVLPAIAFWFVITFADTGAQRVRAAAISVFAIVAGFACNAIALRALGPDHMLPFSNFAHTLYGQAVGGKGWNQVFVDHPELTGIHDPDLSRRIYALAFDQIRQHPNRLLMAIPKTWLTYASPGEFGAFSFVLTGCAPINIGVRSLLLLLTALGIRQAWHTRQDAVSQLILLSFSAVILSAPFLPPLDSIRMRPLAVTMPLSVAVVAIGVTELWAFAVPTRRLDQYQDGSTNSLLLAIGLLILALVSGPILIRCFSRPPSLPTARCAPAEQVAYVQLHRGSYLDVVGGGGDRTFVPRIRREDLQRSYPEMFATDDVAFFNAIDPGTLITEQVDLRTNQLILVALPASVARQFDKPIALCGQRRGRFFTGDRLAR